MPPIFYSLVDSFIHSFNKYKFKKHRESKGKQLALQSLHYTNKDQKIKCYFISLQFLKEKKGNLENK